jgi:hypothetical protein
MWLSGHHVAHHWAGVKNMVGHAWHEGGKWAGHIDRAANLGMRLFGAAAPMLGNSAMEHGVRAINQYQGVRNRVQNIDSNARTAVGRLRAAAPELEL